MRIPGPPYHLPTDELLYTLLTGGDCIGYENLLVNDISAIGLNYPSKAVYALFVVEADSASTDKSKVIRFKEFDAALNPPTHSEGIPLGDLSVYEVKGKENLKNSRVIGIESGKVHSLKVQYFG